MHVRGVEVRRQIRHLPVRVMDRIFGLKICIYDEQLEFDKRP
jgi:hypothetical protein